MNHDFKKEQRVTVADAIKAARTIIFERDESEFPRLLNVFTQEAERSDDKTICPDGKKYRTELVSGKDKALDALGISFLRFCAKTGTKPRNRYDAWNDESYSGVTLSEDYEHDISESEMTAWMARFENQNTSRSERKSISQMPNSEAQGSDDQKADRHAWVSIVRSLACDVYEQALIVQYGTDQKTISEKLEALCDEKKILTAKEKRLTAAYILRHALTPWNIPKIVEAKRQN